MKIILSGGGTGGHFYPLIAIAQEIRDIARREKLVDVELFYVSTNPYDEKVLFENDIEFRKISAGKLRTYSSIKNFFDLFKTGIGIIMAIWKVFWIFPDVIVGKGGYASFPVLVAGKIFKIPIVIHDSDTVPGRVNIWASKFAQKVAISYAETEQYFEDKEKLALVGNPVRRELFNPVTEGSHDFLNLDPDIPTVFVIGGSQGAQAINDLVVDALPKLLSKYQVVHQTGRNNFEQVEELSKVILANSQYKNRYKIFDYLNNLSMRMVAGITDLVITRAGGSGIFEVALWGIPSIVIPIPEEISRDQKKNAYAYAKSGAAIVMEQANLSTTILVSEIDRIMGDTEERKLMSRAAKDFSRPHAAEKVAEETIRIALEHEK
jgi:UDP-N-acetylglucosamine--N-acetylmuramyl-(pentapeptide) pyrophosphoryl-undecaprenol N-acetylglucosamine transferase